MKQHLSETKNPAGQGLPSGEQEREVGPQLPQDNRQDQGREGDIRPVGMRSDEPQNFNDDYEVAQDDAIVDDEARTEE